MTRTERAWHWRLWVVIACALAAMVVIIAANGMADSHRPGPAAAPREVTP